MRTFEPPIQEPYVTVFGEAQGLPRLEPARRSASRRLHPIQVSKMILAVTAGQRYWHSVGEIARSCTAAAGYHSQSIVPDAVGAKRKRPAIAASGGGEFCQQQIAWPMRVMHTREGRPGLQA